ncbi:DUF4157 domain-containing protein [Flavihumibacter sp. R14]|nr:DUF4157 domain-containing protein [Flavihumibacter soli]
MKATRKVQQSRQRAAGGFRNPSHIVQSLGIQRKLSVGAEDDELEREADVSADRVMRMSEENYLQRKCEECEKEEKLQRKTATHSTNQYIQAKVNSNSAVSKSVEDSIQSSRGSGSAIDRQTQSFIGSRMGSDFSEVKVHTNSEAVRLNRGLNARAFTIGNDIYFNEGQYQPGSSDGKRLLAHELTHVLQQSSGSSKEFNKGSTIPVSASSPALIQRKACNFYVYDSTEGTALGTAWELSAIALAMKARGGYAVGSSDTIEYMLSRIVNTYTDKDCDCIEEIQFLSHGSPGDSMYISKTRDEITVADFNIPDLDKYGEFPPWWDMTSAYYKAWSKWFNALSWRQQLFVEIRSYICNTDAEIYYRSCSAFQGKEGQEFAEKSAEFWRSHVIGHTKLIGVTQPGQKTLKPGQKPYWDVAEGAGGTEMKKGGTKPKK